MNFDYEYYTLENGLKVFLMPSDTVNSANVTALIKSGSVHEPDELQGITHFVEHVSLTATKSWPTKEALNETSEFTGSSFNGSTSKEFLKYYINVPYTQVPFGIKFIHEVLYHCTLDPKYIEQERKIIIDEISKVEDSIAYELRSFISPLISKNKSSYTREIAGTKDAIQNYSAEQIKDFYKKVHSPNKVLISVVGNFNVIETKKAITEFFGSIKETESEKDYPAEAINTNVIAKHKSQKTNLVVTNLIVPAPSAREISELEFRQLELAHSILCGPMSSRLMQRLREKENLLYSVYLDALHTETYGYSVVGFDIPEHNYEKALQITLEELDKFCTDGPTEKELVHHKEYISNRKLISNDDVFSYASLIRSALFWNKPVYDLNQKIKLIKEINLQDLKQTINKTANLSEVSGFTFGHTNDEIESIMKDVLKKYV